MSIASAISNAQTKVAAAYTACNNLGATMPTAANQNLSNLASTISTITGGGSTVEFDDWLHDGDTHIWINILNVNQLTRSLRLTFTGTIDWGDGTVENKAATSATTFSHTYSSFGRYRIDLHPTGGTFTLGGASSSYNIGGTRTSYSKNSAIYQVEIGSSIITRVDTHAFCYLYGLDKIYVPQNITIFNSYACYYSYGLRQVIFEDVSKLTSGTAETQQFFYCYNLQNASNFYQVNATTMNGTFRNCYCLAEATIPSKVTDISNYAFQNTFGLQVLHCLPTTPPTLANANVLSGMYSGVRIEVPSESLADYQAASYWSTWADKMVGV